MAIHSSILSWEISWAKEPGRLQSMGWQRVEHDLTTKQLIGLDLNLSILLLFCVCVTFVLFSSFLNRLGVLDDFVHLFCWLMGTHSFTVLMVSKGFVAQSFSASQSTFRLCHFPVMWNLTIVHCHFSHSYFFTVIVIILYLQKLWIPHYILITFV